MNAEVKDVVTKEAAVSKLPLAVVDDSEFSMLMDSSKFAQLQRVGIMYARSKMVPQHFQGDEPSCMVAVQMAMRLHVDPFMFLQKTYVIGGKPGMEAQLAIALINTRGPFAGPIDWDFKRDANGTVLEATAYATHKRTGKVCSATVTWAMVEAEGWNKKPGSKWLTLREQMFAYRSGVFLGRRYCPEVLLGMSTEDELRELAAEVDVTPVSAAEPTRLRDRIVGRSEPQEAEVIDQGTVEVIREAPETAKPAAQEVASAPPAPEKAPEAQPAPASATAKPPAAPAIPFMDALGYAKKAKTKTQIETVRDQMADPGYTDENRQAVFDILNSKKPTE